MHDDSSGHIRPSRERPVRYWLAKKVSESFSSKPTRKELAAGIRFARKKARRGGRGPELLANLACVHVRNHRFVHRFAGGDAFRDDLRGRLSADFKNRPELNFDDAIQHAVAAACDNGWEFESDAQLAAFLFTAATRFLYRQIELGARETSLGDAYEPIAPGSEPRPEVGDGLAWPEGSSGLARAWGTLSPNEQYVVRRRVYDGASYEEIGRELAASSRPRRRRPCKRQRSDPQRQADRARQIYCRAVEKLGKGRCPPS